MSDIELAKELATIFRTTLEYSDGDAEALERTTSVGERCERFLTVGQGVCHEFANSYAAVLMQSFGIAARLCHGHVARPGTGEIAAQAHVWVEVRDPKGQWHGMEPTSSDDRRSAARRSANGSLEPVGFSSMEKKLRSVSSLSASDTATVTGAVGTSSPCPTGL